MHDVKRQCARARCYIHCELKVASFFSQCPRDFFTISSTRVLQCRSTFRILSHTLLVMYSCESRVQLFADACNGWPLSALRYRWLMLVVYTRLFVCPSVCHILQPYLSRPSFRVTFS